MCTKDSTGDHLESSEQQRISDAVQAIAERRAVIEQAKGMLMFLYGIGADEAFDVLRGQSQQHNVKLRFLAEQVLNDLVQLARAKGPVRRAAFGDLELTAHLRVVDTAVRRLDDCAATVAV